VKLSWQLIPACFGVGAHCQTRTFNRALKFCRFDTALSDIIRRAQFAIPPLALMILSSQKVAGVSQTFCDLRFEKLPLDQHWDMAGISVQTGAVRPAFELARALRSRGIKVVLGGPYVSIFPDQCRDHADALVIGEADDIWREVQADLLAGALKPEYRVVTFPDLSIERVVGKSALDIQSYFTTNVVQTTRGCPFSCDFCNVHVMNGHRLRHRSIPAVLREVETFLKEDKQIFFFLDDTINADEEYAEQLFRQLEPFKIKWVGQATTALGEKPRLLHSPDDHDAFKFSWGQEMLYKPLRIPLQEFIPSYTALTSRVFTVQNAVQRAMRAPRLRSAVLMFNLLYVHRYGMARKDLLRQLGEMGRALHEK